MQENKSGNIDESFIIKLLNEKQDINKLKNFYTVLDELKRKPIVSRAYPVWMAIDPTNICTLKCPFCSTGSGTSDRPKGKMSFWDFKKIIDMLGPYLLHIDLQNWGEPLLNENIYRMIEYIKIYHDIHLTLSTNFQNFDEDSAEAMVDSKLDRIIVSIDGASQKTYEKYRRGGDFNRAIRNIEILTEKKKANNSRWPVIIWQFLIFRHNEHEIEKAKKMAEDLGVYIGMTPAFIALDSPEFCGWIPKNQQYSRYKIGKIEKRARSKPIDFKPGYNSCNWLWGGITINWNGSVSPCCGVGNEKDDFCNILKVNNFHSLWNSDSYKLARKYIKYRKKERSKIKNICSGCSKIGQVNYELPADYWLRT